MSLIRRVLITVLAAALLGLGAHAIGGLRASGAEPYLLAGCIAGVILAGLWPWSDRLLGPAVLGLAVTLGVLLLSWRHAPHAISQAAGVVVEQPVAPISSGAALVLTVAAVGLAACCGWLLVRRRTPWPVVALVGSALLARADVTRVYEDRFLLFVIVALILVALTYAPALGSVRTAVPATFAACLLVTFCWGLPAMKNAWSPLFADPVASLTGSGAPRGAEVTTLNLTERFHPSNRLVMSVTINRPDLNPYWQSLVFDQYDGHSWTAGDSSERLVPARSELTAAPGGSAAVTATVQLFQPAETLISTGTPVRASIPTIAVYAPGGPQPVEVRARGRLPEGMIYQVQGTIGEPFTSTPAQLRAFLQLPLEPARLFNLALRLVRNQPDAIKRALAIEGYLRDSGRFMYDVNAGSPASGDAVDTFLFRTHRGYCNQFASAMVVLARAVGIPARLVSGYASGMEELGSYLVSERDAHSWAEVYIPDAGWVALDPTPGFDATPFQLAGGGIGRAVKTTGATASSHRPKVPLGGFGREQPPIPQSRPHHRLPANHSGMNPMLAGIGLLLLLLLAAAAYVLWPRSVAQLYLSLLRTAPRRYGSFGPGDTPREFAERFQDAGAEYHDVSLLTGLYGRQRYARIEPSEGELRAARRAWRRLRRHWLATALRR